MGNLSLSVHNNLEQIFDHFWKGNLRFKIITHAFQGWWYQNKPKINKQLWIHKQSIFCGRRYFLAIAKIHWLIYSEIDWQVKVSAHYASNLLHINTFVHNFVGQGHPTPTHDSDCVQNCLCQNICFAPQFESFNWQNPTYQSLSLLSIS